MTIVFTSISTQSDLIIMNADSAITSTSTQGNWTEYSTSSKIYPFPGVGCVSTWGSRAGNKIGPFLNKQKISQQNHDIEQLADLVDYYLRNHYRPHEEQLDDVGFHVAGFDKNQVPKLYHIFWGKQRPHGIGKQSYEYQKTLSRPGQLLFNGRNDLAQTAVNTLLREFAQGKESNYDLTKIVSLASFGDFVMRFASELTPEVGPPFFTFMISPQNDIQYVKNNRFCPVAIDKLVEKLVVLVSSPCFMYQSE